ncbi:MAG: glycoside hydrolase family 78 protein [Anaerolineales bacterium]|nr:glycoside hydrolase family 78 protein [Anaerolineales bacterium]
MSAVTGLLCEYRENPLGIDVRQPRLSWRLLSEEPGARQTAYQLLAASSPAGLAPAQADLWDSGRVESDQSLHVPYAGPELASRQRVYWRVLVWDETGQCLESEPAWFEMGLLSPADWQADWIGSSFRGGAYSNLPAPYLRRAFALPEQARSARLYVTALGLYECSINGHTIWEDVFNPGWTDYTKRVQYNVYDVTKLLKSGDNVLGVILGDGWAVGRVGMSPRQFYYDRPRLWAQLEITMTDGNTVTIASDELWKYQFGPILENDLIHGEAYDATLEIPGWNSPGFNEMGWMSVTTLADPEIEIVATNGPTVRRFEELKPIGEPTLRRNPAHTRATFDLGQNMVGWVRLQGSAPKGTAVRLRFAEVLDENGELYTANLRGARATDYYTFKGDGVEVWEPKFTFHGFRYVEISGYPGPFTDDLITGVVLHSNMAHTGDFVCSEPLINQLQNNILWGQKGNFVDVPTDCPQRDERMGWTGDIQVFARTAAFNMNVAGFMTKWAQDVADAQAETGSIPAVVPAIIPLVDGGPAWADAGVICPWTMYLCYGDKRILAENYGVMSRFMDFITAASPGHIRCAPDFEGWPGFGDWLSINAPTPRDLIGTAFLAYDAQLMSQIATILGKAADAARYEQLWQEAREAFQQRYLVGGTAPDTSVQPSEMRQQMEMADAISQGNLEKVDYGPVESKVFNTDLFTPNQTAYVLALHFELLPEELRPVATAELVADIERRGMHLSTGFVGAPYLPHVLSANGRTDVAYALLKQTSWPSWLYSVTQGGTTIWERWDGWTEENGFQSPEMNSFNHYAYGSIGAWLYNTVAGIEIDPAEPGYKHILLAPQPGGGLTQAYGRLRTLYGELLSQWQLADGQFTWTIIVPPNTRATATLPAAIQGAARLNDEAVSGTTFELKAGTHQFVVA